MDLTHFVELTRTEAGLCTVATRRVDGTIQASLVNAGVLAHPHTGAPVVGFVARGDARKLAYLRVDPTIALTVRAGWDWATVEGRAEIFGPDDPAPAVDGAALARLLREVFLAAGGTHDDWDAYDTTMAHERRAAVLVGPRRAYTNRA